MQNNNSLKIIWISSIVAVLLISYGNISYILAKTKNSFTDSVMVHLDKTDFFIGNYIVMVKNIDSGKHVENIYFDGMDSLRLVDIPGDIKTKKGQTLMACAMQLITKEVSCDTKTVSNNNTEFFVNMANKTPLDNIIEN
jgi:hypothetical protein